ncbi:MAG: cytochrome c, partial [Vicinamibacterales bacterium]|nr:cytochrome c [Vicinamibacterales bacterium]
ECSTCHAPDMVRSFGRSREEWQEVVNAMIDQGAKLSEEQIPILVDYLVKNWGLESEKPKQAAPQAVLRTLNIRVVAAHSPVK